jgi:hypothetical protein
MLAGRQRQGGRDPAEVAYLLLAQDGGCEYTLSKDHAPEEGNGPVRRSSRPLKPSTCMMGPDWVVG